MTSRELLTLQRHVELVEQLDREAEAVMRNLGQLDVRVAFGLLVGRVRQQALAARAELDELVDAAEATAPVV